MRAKPVSPPCRRWVWCRTATEHPPRVQLETGRTVCACFGMGEKSIVEAIRTRKFATVTEIGDCLKAGTNCGSCVPEVKAQLGQSSVRKVV